MRSGRGRGIGNSFSSKINNLNNNSKGLFSALLHHVFDYVQKGAAYQMSLTWVKFINIIGTIYGHDISNELQNKKQIDIPQLEHTQQVKDKHLKILE